MYVGEFSQDISFMSLQSSVFIISPYSSVTFRSFLFLKRITRRRLRGVCSLTIYFFGWSRLVSKEVCGYCSQIYVDIPLPRSRHTKRKRFSLKRDFSLGVILAVAKNTICVVPSRSLSRQLSDSPVLWPRRNAAKRVLNPA